MDGLNNGLDALYKISDLLLGIGVVAFIYMAVGGVFKDD